MGVFSSRLAFAVVLLCSLPAAAQDLVFCEDSAHCRKSEACVAGVCTAPKNASIRMLFPIAIDRIADLETGTRRGEVPDHVDLLLRRFFELSGYFRVLDGAQNPVRAAFEGLTATTVDFQAWHRAGAYAVVKGQLEPAEKGPILTLKLFIAEDGAGVRLKLDRQRLPNTSPPVVRKAVARWVDAAMTHLTGQGGVFDTRIAFAHRVAKGGAKEIRVMYMDGTGERAITQNGSINMLPAWNVRGEIAYTSFRDNNPDLFVGTQKLSSHRRMNSGAAFNKDGKRMALTLSKDGNAEIYIADARTGKVRRRVTRHSAIDTSPTWSVDSKRLAFVSSRATGKPQIFVVNADGSEPKRLPQAGYYNSSPDWSPTRDVVAYSAMTGPDRYDIYAIELEEGVVRRLTVAGSNEEPSYSRDGRYIVYSSARGGEQTLWMMTADGENQRQISRGPGIHMTPAWER